VKRPFPAQKHVSRDTRFGGGFCFKLQQNPRQPVCARAWCRQRLSYRITRQQGTRLGDDAIRELRVAHERGAEHRMAAVVVVDAGLIGCIDQDFGRLIALLGDEDPVTICGAFETLVSIGAFATEPLAKALPRPASVWHRAAIMNCLMELAPVARPVVLRAMARASQRDGDPDLRASASRNLVALTGAIVMDDIARRKGSLTTNPPSGS
jgi:hypothetical protein